MKTLFRFACAAVLLFASFATHAFCIAASTNFVTVSEYYDAASDRYYSSWSTALSPGSCNFVGNGVAAPAGTTPTGLTWSTLGYADGNARATPVCVFRAEQQVEPASLFLTINAGECAALKRPGSGWTYLAPSRELGGFPSLTAYDVDRTTGACPSELLPVYRFVNRDWPARGNHRYVADSRVREDMHARANWIEEGVAFCVLGGAHAAIAYMQYPNLSPGPGLLPGFGGIDNCPIGWESTGLLQTCIIGANMPTFEWVFGGFDAAHQAPFSALTGALSQFGIVLGYTSVAPNTGRSFVQMLDGALGGGFFVTSADRTSGSVSSVRTESRVRVPNTLRPFTANFEVDMDLVVSYSLFVKQVRASAGEAYVQPLVTLRDMRSGKRLELSAGAIGTPPASDFATRDAATGEVLVFASLAPSSAFGRSRGLPSLQTPHIFDADHSWGWGGDFEWRVNRRGMAPILAAARNVDASLSAEPGDYAIESLGIKGEVVGDASIGYSLQGMSVSVQRP